MRSLTPRLFSNYVTKVCSRVALLDNLKLPAPQTFNIDWRLIEKISASENARKWQDLSIYNQLLTNRKQPAVYYFMIKKGNGKLIHRLFKESKLFHSELRMEFGVRHKDFKNISHVPENYFETKCLYVGSRKKDVHRRLIQHLGYGSGRTGALNLFHILGKERSKFSIEFYCHLLDDKYTKVTEHIESAIQGRLNPIIGKNIYGD